MSLVGEACSVGVDLSVALLISAQTLAMIDFAVVQFSDFFFAVGKEKDKKGIPGVVEKSNTKEPVQNGSQESDY